MIKKVISITFFASLFISVNAQKRAATEQAAYCQQHLAAINLPAH